MIRLLLVHPPSQPLREVAEAVAGAMPPACEVLEFTALAALRASLRSTLGWDFALVDFDRAASGAKPAETIALLRKHQSSAPIVAVSERGSVASAARAIRSGASDFLVRGAQMHERVATLCGKVGSQLRVLRENRDLRDQNRRLGEENRLKYRIVGESPQILAVMERVKRVAGIPRPVLIVGERGTGKELIARAIHAAGPKSAGPLVAVNCAALPDTLLESELFGHERGAFTGADRALPGKFELAAGGTLFLDEIGNMSLAFQQKILRVVEYGTFLRVGGTRELKSAARLVAATNADLDERMARGEFLRDLYDRLSFEVIEVPPLREREGDVELLARHYLEEFMREVPALRGKTLAAEAIEALARHRFPGNVRELRNLIERAAYRDATQEINATDLGPLDTPATGAKAAGFEDSVLAFERGLLLDAERRAQGNHAGAARLLGLSYHQFRYYWGKHFPKAAGGGG